MTRFAHVFATRKLIIGQERQKVKVKMRCFLAKVPIFFAAVEGGLPKVEESARICPG